MKARLGKTKASTALTHILTRSIYKYVNHSRTATYENYYLGAILQQSHAMNLASCRIQPAPSVSLVYS